MVDGSDKTLTVESLMNELRAFISQEISRQLDERLSGGEVNEPQYTPFRDDFAAELNHLQKARNPYDEFPSLDWVPSLNSQGEIVKTDSSPNNFRDKTSALLASIKARKHLN